MGCESQPALMGHTKTFFLYSPQNIFEETVGVSLLKFCDTLLKRWQNRLDRRGSGRCLLLRDNRTVFFIQFTIDYFRAQLKILGIQLNELIEGDIPEWGVKQRLRVMTGRSRNPCQIFGEVLPIAIFNEKTGHRKNR